MADDVEVDILFNTKQAQKSLDRLEKSFSDFSQTATKETKKASSAMDTFKGVLGAQSLVAGFGLLKNAASGLFNVFITDGIAAAKVQEDAINSLNISLKASGQFTEEASKDFQDYASSLQSVTKFGDEAILQNAALIQSLGQLDQEGLKGATKAALDMSAALGISLTSAATLVGKAAVGEIGSFSRYGLAIKKGSDNAETFANALDQINSKFGGAAEGQVKTFSGASQQLSNTFGDLTETFGFFVTKNSLVVAAIGGLQKGIAKLDTFVKSNEDTIREFIENGVLFAVDSIKPLGSAVVFLNDAFNGLINVWDFARLGLNELVGVFVDGTLSILETAKAAKEFLGLDTSGIDETIASVRLLAEVSNEVSEEISDGIDKRIEAQDRFKETVESVTETVSSSIKKEIELEKAKTLALQEEGEKQSAVRLGNAEKQLTEKEQIDAKVLELEKAKSAKTVDLKAQEIVKLNELEAIEKERKTEEREVRVELETGEADTRLTELANRLGQAEAIRTEAETRRLAKEGKVSQAKKLRLQADAKAEKENILSIQKFEDLTQKQRVANLSSTLGSIASLQSSNNKTLFAIGKAAAISTATIDGIAGVQKALGSAPPPFNFILAGLVGVAAATNVAKIAGSSPPSFQGGGVVGGAPQDRDNQLANVASGEVILNRRQQANTLFQLANNNVRSGGGGSNLNITIEAGIGGISTEQVDFLIDSINDRTEFGNQSINGAA